MAWQLNFLADSSLFEEFEEVIKQNLRVRLKNKGFANILKFIYITFFFFLAQCPKWTNIYNKENNLIQDSLRGTSIVMSQFCGLSVVKFAFWTA